VQSRFWQVPAKQTIDRIDEQNKTGTINLIGCAAGDASRPKSCSSARASSFRLLRTVGA